MSNQIFVHLVRAANFIFQEVFNKEFLACSGFFDDRMILITLSMFSTETDNPINM